MTTRRRKTAAKTPTDSGQPVSGGSEELNWRLERLEQQMLRLTELIREHAEDNDRLVRIVAEDRELIRKELLRRHQAQLRARDFLRRIPAKAGLNH
ncbi:hypothetical protein YTPLAS18_17330 [Nitrospira sp.]|nr:hypothetical protein YTPLAS18_17330 [Nitrospira sp.]